MSVVKKMAEERMLPELTVMQNGKRVKNLADFEIRRQEIKDLLQKHEYGYIPKKPDHLSVKLLKEDTRFCAGKAPRRELEFTVTVGEKSFTFPVVSVIPKSEKKLPAFVSLNFDDCFPNQYLPVEEIIDRGFAVFAVGYNRLTKDNPDMKDGIAPLFVSRRRKLSDPGKIAMWAWCAMRIMDYVESLSEIDCGNVAVIGHSRLGKTALLAGAFDERFKFVISNGSGCSGAAITRGKEGEKLDSIINAFSYWFCEKYKAYQYAEEKLPLDQHFLTSLIAPRHLLVGSAEQDAWADPKSEFLATALANEAYKLYGMQGLVYGDSLPCAKTVFSGGDSCYHIRLGEHYLSREDWNIYMDYIIGKMG